MIQNHFVADNSRFGVVLSRVLVEHGISTRRFTALCGVKTQRVCDLKKGNGDYRLSVYVRVVSTLRLFIFDEEEFKRVKQQLMEAAFDDDYILQQRE